MAYSTIKIEPQGSKRVRITLTYEPGADDPARPNDYHVEYRKDGAAGWTVWRENKLVTSDGDWVEGGFDLPLVLDAVGEPPEDGKYAVRLRWTRDGEQIGGATTTLEVGGCFIATAAYGSPMAPEVQFLRDLRDDVLRRTRWGTRFFDAYWPHYYRISPAIAEQMRRDPELNDLVRWSLVTPWVNYMRLVATAPRWDRADLDGLDPEVRGFIERLRSDMEAWLSAIELPSTYSDLDPRDAAAELNVALEFVLGSQGIAYLDALTARGELPLRVDPAERESLVALLVEAGRDRAEIERIVPGVSPRA